MLIDPRYFRYFDWLSFIITVTLSVISLFFVFSSTYQPAYPYSIFFKKQLFGIVSGFVLYFIFSIINYRSLCRFGYFIYFVILCLLAFAMVKGSIGMGAQRWINLRLFKFQPSELAKLFLPAFITYYFYTEQDTAELTIKNFVPPLIILGISTLFILKQPDLGTAIIISASGLILIWLAGISRWFFVISLLITLITAPLSWHLLKDYQKQRIAVFLGYGENQNERYQIEQSKIAVGSGGMTGKGFLQGTQNKLAFLPERRTDFIFSVIAEEWGFIGVLFIILLYTTLFTRILLIIKTMQFYEQLLTAGLIIHIVFSTLINVGMVLGLAPIVGIPLPLMSYGISHTWITLSSLGWINGITIRRFYVNH